MAERRSPLVSKMLVYSGIVCIIYSNRILDWVISKRCQQHSDCLLETRHVSFAPFPITDLFIYTV